MSRLSLRIIQKKQQPLGSYFSPRQSIRRWIFINERARCNELHITLLVFAGVSIISTILRPFYDKRSFASHLANLILVHQTRHTRYIQRIVQHFFFFFFLLLSRGLTDSDIVLVPPSVKTQNPLILLNLRKSYVRINFANSTLVPSTLQISPLD